MEGCVTLDVAKAGIATDEAAMNEATFALYGLSADERAMVLPG